ncbi:MAG: mercuric ion transport protein [Cognaticolwellia sp.]|jgi:mercuric ion transport protein|nr:mercury transporter [Pseudoalteromonas sp.]|tara:strand:+ start:1389 stop:1736 length:348 start_codon:yes stop_codon:yes gene_type:complete
MSTKESNLPLISGVIAAIGAGICCAGPLILLFLGVSGSWIGNLTAFEPYRPIFIIAVVIAFGFAGWKVHRPIKHCEPDSVCAVPETRKRRQLMFWLSAIFALCLVTSNYWILWLA